MCGSMRLRSGERVRFGGDLYARVSGNVARVRWNGFAREESLATVWKEKGLKATVDVGSYEEHGYQFPVPNGTYVAAILLTKPNAHHSAGELLIVTRDAETPGEKAAHHRHPLLVKEAA